MHIHTESVGNHFGTVGVFVAKGGAKVVTDVLPYGFDSAAREQAYQVAVKTGLVVEIGEVTESTPRVYAAAKRAGVTILLDRYVVVASDAPGARTYDWAGAFEAALS